jgi:hypothetical protein
VSWDFGDRIPFIDKDSMVKVYCKLMFRFQVKRDAGVSCKVHTETLRGNSDATKFLGVEGIEISIFDSRANRTETSVAVNFQQLFKVLTETLLSNRNGDYQRLEEHKVKITYDKIHFAWVIPVWVFVTATRVIIFALRRITRIVIGAGRLLSL